MVDTYSFRLEDFVWIWNFFSKLAGFYFTLKIKKNLQHIEKYRNKHQFISGLKWVKKKTDINTGLQSKTIVP